MEAKPVSSTVAELAAKVLAVPADERETLLAVLTATAPKEAAGNQAGKKAGPGRFYDPKTDKTYRMRRPVRRSTLFMECEQLQKAAVDNLRKWCKEHHIVYDTTNKTSKKVDGKDIPADELKELERLKLALTNAKAQRRAVHDAEGVKRGQPVVKRDPNKLPTLSKNKDGKVVWADDKSQASTS